MDHPAAARDLSDEAGPPDPASLMDAAETLEVILDPARRGALYPYFHRLRELEPLHRTDVLHGRPAWVLTAHADALQVLSNYALVSDARNAEVFNTGPSGQRFFELMKRTLLFIDPAQHGRIRRVMSRLFTRRAVERHRPLMQRVVDGLLDRAAQSREMDLVADFAFELPTAVICEILGVPREDLPILHGWLYDFARRGDVSGVTPEVERRGEEATIGFSEYFRDLLADRRRRPRDDLATRLALAEDERGRLDEDVLVANCILMIQAGHETTADMIALGMLALLRNPEQLRLLRSEPHRMGDAVEELLRYDGSNQLVQRVGSDDFQLRDVTVRAGEVCAILCGATNRDPARFPHPDRLDIRRAQVQHFTFGYGNHICLGASIARAEIQTALGRLLSRFPKLELIEEPPFRDSLVLRGLRSLRLRL